MPIPQCIGGIRGVKAMENICAGGVAGKCYLTTIMDEIFNLIVHEHIHNHAYT